ncbi:kinesin-like nuclear fusion protein [Pseudocyphellaria aurata]|nr:kinesin-like nuclear fusion protein [Pseudocyphellaria aurata]
MPPPTNLPGRKINVDLGGEPHRSKPAHSNSRPANETAKPTNVARMSRQTSYSTSSSSQPFVGSSRPASFSSSVGPSIRQTSAQFHRSQSAMASSRIQKPTPNLSRPTTASEPFSEKSSMAHGDKKRKGILLISSNPRNNSARLGIKESYDTQLNNNSSWASRPYSQTSFREVSLNAAFSGLSLHSKTPSTPMRDLEHSVTPSQLPKRISKVAMRGQPMRTPSSSKYPRKAPDTGPFLTRDSNTRAASPSWGPFEEREEIVVELADRLNQSISDVMEKTTFRETVDLFKARVAELESIKTQLTANNIALQVEIQASKSHATMSATTLEDIKRNNSIQIDDLERRHRRDLEDASRESQQECRDLTKRHDEEMNNLKRRLEIAVESESKRHEAEVQALTTEGALTLQRAEVEFKKHEEANRALEESLQQLRAELSHERGVISDLQVKLSKSSTESSNLEDSVRSLQAHVIFLESDSKSQSHAFVDLETRLQSALKSVSETNEKLRNEETLRRKLHNQVQELRGNIRVFCRVRPSLGSEPANEAARIIYPDTGKDSKEVEILGPEEKSSLGNITTKTNAFTFDRVFTPEAANADVFEEISQLVQSALDGYNVCIFCYGQTGSGKTYTMSAEDGMIPLAVHQIYDTAKSLEEKGWKYSMEGSFIEVYNENLNDLLGKPDEYDKKKHDIRHDMQKCKTTISDITTVDLDAPSKVESLLRRATANRSVAATNANERSSRSHSVFILKLTGQNDTTGERSEGTLNLVDLAGSERLSHSKATGERLKETQNINKSLSCLGDVIGALGQGKEGGHIPYRNSKLTYLLQFSLGGNSKTLMFVMISPRQAHLNETLTSLKFATKVHNTHIGTAKKQTKIRDS